MAHACGVVLPTARTGLITAVILGIARIVGETAPLILTAFGASLINSNPFRGPQDALPLFVYRQITASPQANVTAAGLDRRPRADGARPGAVRDRPAHRRARSRQHGRR